MGRWQRILAVGAEGVASGTPYMVGSKLLQGWLTANGIPLGLIGLADPLRSEVPAAIATAHQAGVRVVMVTGDGPVTARAIADQAGLPAGPVWSGDDLTTLTAARLAETSVFARMRPQQKLQLVQALQASGAVVAMGGDGVNDAPALKAADIGVAMGRRGTATAREAADLVLLNDSFADLVAALAVGRRVEANLHRALGYTLAIHLPIAALGLLPLVLAGQGLILLPMHIALLHLVIDPVCTVIFEALPGGPQLLRQPPRPPQAPLFSGHTWRQALGQGAVLTLAALVLAHWPGADPPLRRSLVFSLLLLTGGGLVWLNGGRVRAVTTWGAVLGGVLALLVQGSPWIRRGLALAPLPPPAFQLVGLVTALALLGCWLVVRTLSWPAPSASR